MLTDTHNKVTTAHLQRDAYLYVRQSSLRQVLENTESSKRQYALRERAVALGWAIENIHTIDSDQGQSGASAEHRDGFQYLVTQVAMGQVGIVLGLEVSRLARNNADWHRLIELAALSQTLILDEDGVYDPSYFNDRLLLGLKGTMSEAELHVIKARLQGGIRNKAQRGELLMSLPIGLVYRDDGTITLDPDQQIQQAIRLLFDTFKSTGSAMSVVKYFNKEGWQFPRRIRKGIGKGNVMWGSVLHSRVIQILHNPRYAGAFVYGRTRSGRTADLRPVQTRLPREQWLVLIQEAHVGYIDWETYEQNQETLRKNAAGFGNGNRGSVPREGTGLLQGRVICGLCGARMRVRYQKVSGHMEPYYQCNNESLRQAGKLCQSTRGSGIDDAIGSLLLDTVSPVACEVALAVQEEITLQIEKSNQVRQTQLERARYEAELARRRYMQVDPDFRLVADTLEAEWNEKLRLLDDLQQSCEQHRIADSMILTDEARKQIMELTNHFSRVWNDPGVKPIDKKHIVALLIEDVTITKAQKVLIQVRFRGGKTHSMSIPTPLSMAQQRRTPLEVVEMLDELLETCTDQQAADQLNKLGYRNWQGKVFDVKKVAFIRQANGLKSHYHRLRDRGFLRANEMAKQLGISPTTVHKWGREGLLIKEQYGRPARCLYKPLKDSVKLVKGTGGHNSQQPKFINVQLSKQEIV